MTITRCRLSRRSIVSGMSRPHPSRAIARPRTLTAMIVVSALVMSTWLVAQPALAAAPAPTVRYTFDGNATDQAGGSALTPAPACPGNPCNTSTGFGSDGAGGYWEWTSSGLNGGGFRVSTAAPIGDTYTLALKFSFDEVSGYRKIVDYENQTSDNGFYFYDGFLEFYPFSEQSPSTYPAGTVLDLVAVRQSTGASAAPSPSTPWGPTGTSRRSSPPTTRPVSPWPSGTAPGAPCSASSSTTTWSTRRPRRRARSTTCASGQVRLSPPRSSRRRSCPRRRRPASPPLPATVRPP